MKLLVFVALLPLVFGLNCFQNHTISQGSFLLEKFKLGGCNFKEGVAVEEMACLRLEYPLGRTGYVIFGDCFTMERCRNFTCRSYDDFSRGPSQLGENKCKFTCCTSDGCNNNTVENIVSLEARKPVVNVDIEREKETTQQVSTTNQPQSVTSSTQQSSTMEQQSTTVNEQSPLSSTIKQIQTSTKSTVSSVTTKTSSMGESLNKKPTITPGITTTTGNSGLRIVFAPFFTCFVVILSILLVQV